VRPLSTPDLEAWGLAKSPRCSEAVGCQAPRVVRGSGTKASCFAAQAAPHFLYMVLAACSISKFHDQGDAEWIVIRGQLRGHNDMP
jgi:hypothetical protein